MESVNPATGDPVETYEDHDEEAIDETLEAAHEAFDDWRRRDVTEREQLIESAADVLRENEDEYAAVMTEEMGKPIDSARAEVEKCAWVCAYYAEHAGEFLADERLAADADVAAFTSYEPLGPVLAVMPWNFPFWQAFRFIAPHLTAGNVGLLKHASNVPGCALAIEAVLEEAGYPEGVFTSLLVGADQVERILEDDRLAAATLTGSDGAGRAVAGTAGGELKKTVLELGGSDPFVVLEDAPLEAACRVGARARTINSGQSCIAAKRFVVVEDVYEAFVDGFTAEMDALTVGDPMDPVTDVGPQARSDLVAALVDQVEATVDAGATVELGGEPLEREGYFYPPTVLTDVPEDSPAAREEVFGPVAAVFSVPDEAAAIELANDTRFGLGASVWTTDLERGRRVCRELEAGLTFVNELVKSDPRHPFGGVEDSGYGRELGRDGILEFVNRKTVWVQHGRRGGDETAVE
ncbi:NAD-dependent succinate-semialdehyde dehydrogenase [Natronobeatus ordinarius]|uniref:NAD-dependent succinate-semialdehyde dehydrogenase n=1 Tax=Natronobeatus ordinarius TaxID=2963433 RepID=UPI0020CB712E|nr:NAD-dependent succinate-semialdehyde dehydrogenase [Natronobeatus ordinarius]